MVFAVHIEEVLHILMPLASPLSHDYTPRK
jgi:hypothetical protein